MKTVIGQFLMKCAVFSCALISVQAMAQQTPPYAGTVYLDPSWVAPEDPITLTAMTYRGQEFATLFDRRVNAYRYVSTYSYSLNFSDEVSVVAQKNTRVSTGGSAGDSGEVGQCIGTVTSGAT